MTQRILVADDSSTIQKVIGIAFSKFQVKIDVASQFSEALNAIHLAKPALIIADASLPGMTGPGDFKRLAGNAQETPVILLKGSYDSIDEASLRSQGYDEIIKKPFGSQDIVRAARAVLGYEFPRKAEGAPTPSRQTAAQPTVRGETFGGGLPELAGTTRSEPPLEVGLARSTLLHREPTIDLDDDVEGAAGHPDAEKIYDGLLGQEFTDDRRRGERAFAASSAKGLGHLEPKVDAKDEPVPAPAAKPAATKAASFPSSIAGYEPPKQAKVKSILEPMIRDELAKMVRETVEEYCARHFPALARDIITKEIRRLADEKTRYLVDN